MDPCEINQNSENPQNGSKREEDESDDEKYATIKKNKIDNTTKSTKNEDNFSQKTQENHIKINDKNLKKDEALSNVFDLFCGSNSLSSIMKNFQNLRDLAGISPQVLGLDVYWQLKTHIRSWKAENLWSRLDKKLSSEEYSNASHAKKLNILVIGCGPCGLRMGIEGALLGHRVVMVEKREGFTRNNVLHLWSFLIHDLKALGAKLFFGRFCSGSIDHICIRTLQCILLKVALLLGVEVDVRVEFDQLVEPSVEGEEWGASFKPSSYRLSLPYIDVCVSADGRRNTMPKFKRLEFRGKLAIAITANFINNNTAQEAAVPEISGVSFIFKQPFFQKLCKQTGIDLENIVYYKDETHYFVMTAKKHSLLSKKVLLKDYDDPQQLLHKDNVDQQELLSYAFEAATFVTDHKLPQLQFAINHNQQPDVAMFDFTSMYAAESASRAMEKHKKVLLLALVGDTLVEPFWPIGSGCGRGFLGVMDTAWMIRSWSLGVPLLQVITERESAYQLLSQTTPESLNKNTQAFSIDPNSRYVNLQSFMMQPIQVRHLFEGAEDYVMSTCATSNIINNTNNKKKNNNNNNFNNNNNYDNNVNVNGDAKNYVRNTELKDFYDVGDFKEKLNGEEPSKVPKKSDHTDSGLYVQTRDSYIRDLFKLPSIHREPHKHTSSNPSYLPSLNSVANVMQQLGGNKQKSAELTRLNTSVCFSCKQRVYLVQQLQVEGLTLHRNCFSCSYCRTALHKQHYSFNKQQGRFFCKHHRDLVRRADDVVIPYEAPVQVRDNPFRLTSNDEDDWMSRPISERAGYTTEDEGADEDNSSVLSLYDQFRSSSEEELQRLAYADNCEAPDLEWMMILRQHVEEKRRLRKLSNRGSEEGSPCVERDTGRSSSEATVGASDADWETDDDDDSDDSDNDSRDNFQPSALNIADYKNKIDSQIGRRRTDEMKKDVENKQNGGVVSTQRKETSLHNRMSFFSAPTQPVRINARTFLGLDVPSFTAATNGEKEADTVKLNETPIEDNVEKKVEEVDESVKLSQTAGNVIHNVENKTNDGEDAHKTEETTSVISNEHINNKEDKKGNADWSDEGRDGREVDMRKMMKQSVKKDKHKKIKHRTKKLTKRRKKNIKRLISGHSDKSSVVVDRGVKGNHNGIETSHKSIGEPTHNDNASSTVSTTSTVVTKAASFTNIATNNAVAANNNNFVNEAIKTISIDTVSLDEKSTSNVHTIKPLQLKDSKEVNEGNNVENVDNKEVYGVEVVQQEESKGENNSNENKDNLIDKIDEIEKHVNNVVIKDTTQISENNRNIKVGNVTKNDNQLKTKSNACKDGTCTTKNNSDFKDDVFVDGKSDKIIAKASLVNGTFKEKSLKNQGDMVVKTEEIRRRNREIVTLSMSSDSVLDNGGDDISEVVVNCSLNKDLEVTNRLENLLAKQNHHLSHGLKNNSDDNIKAIDLLKGFKQNIDGTASSSASTLTSETFNRCTLAASLLDDLIKTPPTPPLQHSSSRRSSSSENAIIRQSQATTTICTSQQQSATTTTTQSLTNSQESKEDNVTNKLVSPSKLLDAKRRFFHEATQPVRIDPKSFFGDLSIRNAGSRSAKELLERLDGSKEKMLSKAEEAVKRIEDIIKNHDPFSDKSAGSSTDPVKSSPMPQKSNQEGSSIDKKDTTDSRNSTSSEDSQTIHEGRLIKYSPEEYCGEEERTVVEEVESDEFIKQQKTGLSLLSKILRARHSNKPPEEMLRSKKKPLKPKSFTTTNGSKRWSYDGKSARKNDSTKRKISKKGMYRELAPMIEGIRVGDAQDNIKTKLECLLSSSHQLILPPKANLDDFETESEVGDDRCSIWSGHSDKSQLSEEERIKKRKKQLRMIRKKHKEKELIRMETLQEVMRQLHEVEGQLVALEQRGVCIEQVLNQPEAIDDEEEEKLVQEWLHVVQQKNDLNKKESELVIQTRELQLEDSHCQLELQLQENIHNSESSNKEMEGMLLQELMVVVEKRDKLVTLLEEERLRHKQYDSNLQSIMLQKGIQQVKTNMQASTPTHQSITFS